jgi:hypothetical protein
MAQVQCRNRHFYDDKNYTNCPYCPVLPGDSVMPTTIAAPAGRTPETARSSGTQPSGRGGGSAQGVPGVTVGVEVRHKGIDPVVGWLVCVKGVNKGRDYRLHSDFNKIGRATNMDVCIEGDETITRETHCKIAYSPRSKEFTIIPDDGRNFVYLNGKDLLTAMALQPLDLIEIGDSSFRFQPFCSSQFNWSDIEDEDEAGKAPAKPASRDVQR